MIKVCIVEDNNDYLDFLTQLLNSSDGIEMVGYAKTGRSGLALIKEKQPDIALVDIGLPDMNGMELVKAIRQEGIAVQLVMLTIYDTDEKIFDSIRLGANSFVSKNSEPLEIIEAIHGVYTGQSPINGDIARKLFTMLQGNSSQPVKPALQAEVTPKEAEILELLAKGHTYIEISDALNITVKTLKGHIYRMYLKLHVDNRTEAVNKYYGK